MNFQEENNQLIQSFLERTFFNGWRNPHDEKLANFQSVEFFWGRSCNLACKYCYLNKYGEELYPARIENSVKILKNLEMILNWMIQNEFAPKRMEFFSGEPLINIKAFEGIEMIIEKFKNKKKKPEFISVPTNLTFILNDQLTKKVEELLKKSRKYNIPVFLSTSMDGKYCEGNRPFKVGIEKRDDKYYEKVFRFAKKWNFGFHPMIYSELIENWQENFLWFQENFKKHGLPWSNIYLLEVRNAEWNERQITDFGKFIEFLIKWTFKERCNSDNNKFIDFLFNDGGYNILRGPLSFIGRGIGCGIQANLTIRLGDLTIVPCHRTSYEPLILAQIKTEKNKIVSIETKSPELMIATYSHDAKNQPYCENCLLKYLCAFGCFGSQLEITGDMFAPIPTVCQLEHVKIGSMIKAYKELKIFEDVLEKIDEKKALALRELEKMI
ncbi:MAG: radical SAM protein [Candidatus Paceibacterota bacterium]|jgi:radical SAM protein with 4Fe4S-binding SPASM domain